MTGSRRGAGLGVAVRVVAIVVLAVVAWAAEPGWLRVAAFFVVLSLLGSFLRDPAVPPVSWTPGDHQVVLESPGDTKIQVIKQLRELFGLDLQSAKRAVDVPPSQVGPPMSSDDAAAVCDRLRSAGAAVRIERIGGGVDTS